VTLTRIDLPSETIGVAAFPETGIMQSHAKPMQRFH